MDRCSICGKHKAKYVIRLISNGNMDLPTYQVCGYCLKYPDIFISDKGWKLSKEGRKKVAGITQQISKKYKGKKVSPSLVEEIVLDVLDFCVRVVLDGDYEIGRRK